MHRWGLGLHERMRYKYSVCHICIDICIHTTYRALEYCRQCKMFMHAVGADPIRIHYFDVSVHVTEIIYSESS